MIKTTGHKKIIRAAKGHGLARHLLIIFSALFVLSALNTPAGAADVIGRFSVVEGRVDVLREGKLPAIAVKVSDSVFVKDIIRTKSDAKAEITFSDGNVLRISQRSRIDISEYVSEEKGNRTIALPRGKAEAFLPARLTKQIDPASKTGRFEIHTPNAVAGVRGTCYTVSFGGNITWVYSIDQPECSVPGTVYVYNFSDPGNIRDVTPGHMTTVKGAAPPVLPMPASRGEAAKIGEPGQKNMLPEGSEPSVLDKTYEIEKQPFDLKEKLDETGLKETETKKPVDERIKKGVGDFNRLD